VKAPRRGRWRGGWAWPRAPCEASIHVIWSGARLATFRLKILKFPELGRAPLQGCLPDWEVRGKVQKFEGRIQEDVSVLAEEGGVGFE
jgi:hypothetical protein